MMTSRQIRQSYLDFFRQKQHVIVPSSPVVIPADPTLLFANAGMNQFKEIFLGARKPTEKRVANTQKCIRVSGKHNDLEEVGRDTYHHTFFEMLGNWSFGDYYKREAIQWAWELLTGVWGIEKRRLWVTVYKTDDEAMSLWKEVTDIDPTHILRFAEKDNFWEMGETGPCGPCSEIHYDRTPAGNAPASLVNAGSPDLIEIWNLVFMQYNRKSDGSLEDLPAKNVDTGMGFERVCSVLQVKASNYDTDIFQPLIEAVRGQSGRPYEGEEAVAMRVIADHLRTLSFAIADGVVPSNEGRGYVLRRLLRRAVRFGRRLGYKGPFLGGLLPVLEESMADFFPELTKNREQILRVLRAEEDSFSQTLDRGLALFDEVVAGLRTRGEKVFPGDQAFRLYDTFGFPLDLTRLMAGEQGLQTDEAGFEQLMGQQRERARSAQKGASGAQADAVASFIGRGLKSAFNGYATDHEEARVLAILADDGEVGELAAGGRAAVLLSVTPFYGEAGGQLGDTGHLENDAGLRFVVEDTQKPAEGIILHRGRLESGHLKAGDAVQAIVECSRRSRLASHHTATHLLNAALRKFLGDAVKQAGSLVAPDRLRFDFNWFEPVAPDVLEKVERQVNAWIIENIGLKTYHMALKDVPGSGIVAVFDEKYGETVRVVEVPGVSRELCGGTHAARTGQIGLFRIAGESSVASGVRRIEAVCGMDAYEWTRREHELVRSLCQRFSATPEELPARIETMAEHGRKLEKELKARESKDAMGRADALAASCREVKGIPLVAGFAGELSMDVLRQLMDAVRQKAAEAVIVLGSSCEGKACFVASVPDALVKKGVHAGKLIGQVAKLAGGGGGGQPGKAQAGGKDGAKAEAAMAAVPDLLGA